MKTSEVLLKAVDVLDRQGWWLFELQKKDENNRHIPGGPVCMEGAIRCAMRNTDSVPEAKLRTSQERRTYESVKSVCEVALQSKRIHMSLSDFNDHLAESKEHVQSIFRDAAKIADEKGL